MLWLVAVSSRPPNVTIGVRHAKYIKKNEARHCGCKASLKSLKYHGALRSTSLHNPPNNLQNKTKSTSRRHDKTVQEIKTLIFIPNLSENKLSMQWLMIMGHITPTLNPHWSPIRQRVTCKLATLVHKCVNDHAPECLLQSVLPSKCRLTSRNEISCQWKAPRTSLGVRDHGLMSRPVSDRPRSWSYTFGLVSNTVCVNKMLCDMLMLKCSKHLCSFVQISTETVTNVTGHHFFDVFCTKLFFDNKHASCNRRVFSCYEFLLLLNWSWS